MLKLTGAALIIISAALWGFMQADRLKRRQTELSRIISCLTLLENEITYGKRDIKRILTSLGELNKLELFTLAGEYVESCGVKDGFLKAMEECCNVLSGTDKEILSVLSENLGMTDGETQIKSIRHAKALLEGAEVAASGDYERTGRLYRNSGVLVGLATVILLL